MIFIRKAIVHFIYLIVFTTNSLYITENRLTLQSKKYDNLIITALTFDLALILYGFYFVYSAIIKFFLLGRKNTLNSVWNYIRIITIVICNACLILDILHIFEYHSYLLEVKSLHSIALFFVWLFMIGFSRGFKGTAFMIRIIIQVMYDIRFFLLIMILLMLSFSFSGF